MTSSPEADRELLSQFSPGAAGPGAAPGAAGTGQPGDLDLADRHALRRVAGLSTELADVTEVEYRALRLERVVLVGVWTEGTLAGAENSLRELSALAETAGSVVLAGLMQRRGKPDPATYIGAGKARELADVVTETGADTVICDGELTPGQLRSLEGVVRVKVVDRTALILDIFAQHARTKAGKAQVELAQLEYLLPRLRGWGESLPRAPGADPVRLLVHPDRHRRLRPPPATPARRGVPVHARGGRRRRPDPACRGRQRRRPPGADQRGPRGARPDRRRQGARDRGGEQGRLGRSPRGQGPVPGRARDRGGVREDRSGAAGPARCRRGSPARPRHRGQRARPLRPR